MHLARKLLALSAREWRDLLVAQFALFRAELAMRTRPTGALMSRWGKEGTSGTVDAHHLSRAREIGDAVRRVALFGVTRPQCLARSIAISSMLEREGIRGAIVRIGVRPQDARIAAHAWVEFAGEIVGDSPAHVRGFELLATAHGAPKR
jgi:Transglutaminase-like superfamily